MGSTGGRHRTGGPYAGTGVTRHRSGTSAPKATHRAQHSAGLGGWIRRLFAESTTRSDTYDGRHRNDRRENIVRGTGRL